MVISFISLFLFLSTGISVFGAAPVTIKSKPAMQWHCLQSVVCSAKGANCASGEGVVPGHRAKLTTKSTDLPARNSQTGVFVCVGTKQGNICTSGDGKFDSNMLGYDGVAKLGQVVGYKFQGLFTSKTTPVEPSSIYANNSRKLSLKTGTNTYKIIEPLEMQDYTPSGLPRKWLALNLITPEVLSVGGQGGEQQGTFTFEGALGRCTSISWDPYGIIFDSQSLEPVEGVKVTLTKQRADGKFTIALGDDIPSILNPITTIEDGAFEFFVPNGTYRLDLATSGFTYPSTAKLNPNYSKIYSEIYYGEDIVEKGATEHRDVPIDSKTTPYHSAVKVMAYFPLLDKGTNEMVIQGRVSHPLTKINIFGKKPSGDKAQTYVRTKLLTSLTADKTGQFDIRYNMNKLAPTEIIGDIEFVKPDYMTMKDSVSTTTAKNDTLVVEPIPNYLEGYAYDVSGRPIPNATVGVYLNLSNKPAYETTADANGFYRISSEYLPSMSYAIRYSGSNGSNAITTSQFVAQNAKYLETQKSNLFVFKDKKGKTFSQEQREKFTSDAAIQPTDTNEPSAESTTQKQQISSNVLPLVIILVLLGLGGVAAIVYFMKKK